MNTNTKTSIELTNFLSLKEILNNFLVLRNILSSEKEEVILGVALVKSGYVLPGLRLLYRYSSGDTLKKVFSKVTLFPSDLANIYFQTISVSDIKLIRFINNLGILPQNISEKEIETFGIREIVINGIPTDITITKIKNQNVIPSINYYVDEKGNFIVLLNGNRFVLPSEIDMFVEEGNFKIELKAIFDFGLPDERVFFKIIKSPIEDATPYFDPMIKVDSLISKIESGRIIDFFHEFINLLASEFDLINKESIKRAIIENLKFKNQLWILLEIKNVISFLYSQSQSPNLMVINKNIESFLGNYEFDLISKRNTIKIITPIFDYEKYLGEDAIGYINKIKSTEVMLVNEENEIRLLLKDGEIQLGRLNPNTAKDMSELNGKILSTKLIVQNLLTAQTTYLPEIFKLWVEIIIARI